MFFGVAKSRSDLAARRTTSGDRVVVGMVLVAAILTLELLTVAVLVVDKPIGRTPL